MVPYDFDKMLAKLGEAEWKLEHWKRESIISYKNSHACINKLCIDCSLFNTSLN